ncbi:MAG: hypothetical protein KDE49_05925 [Novosphingobium sp.]|nr:hypothetical protein [Novosphingobium sp.]
MLASSMLAGPALAQDGAVDARIEALEARIEALEAQNRQLMELLQRDDGTSVQATPGVTSGGSAASAAMGDLPPPEPTARPPATAGMDAPPAPPVEAGDRERSGSTAFVGLDPDYSFRILDVAENVTTKPLIQLRTKQAGGLTDRITLSGGLTVIADYQFTDHSSKFGYLTRHPTATNQIGKHVSEAVIHSAQLAMTARLTDYLTGFFELLYDPEQSFGSGTLTDLNRNQIQLRRGWLLWGNLDKRPVYALIGKMDIPFGLNDTVSPFTTSTNYHAFAGLAYGAQLGYFANGLHLRAMAVQGGAQFRSANTPVGTTAVPSRLNNFALDANYTLSFWGEDSVMVGASYQHGTAYCQPYPVFHFTACPDNVPAVAAYARARLGGLTLLGEYAQTTKVWPGTAVPEVDPRLGGFVTPPQVVWAVAPNPLSVYGPVKPKSFTIGGRYEFGGKIYSPQSRRNALSLEFSRFISGADGSPWEGQSQTVLGFSHFLSPSINLFGELIYVDGFVPLNFLSGGNFADGSTWSDQSVDTGVILIGAQAAF